jgi:hypothetical protein
LPKGYTPPGSKGAAVGQQRASDKQKSRARAIRRTKRCTT